MSHLKVIYFSLLGISHLKPTSLTSTTLAALPQKTIEYWLEKWSMSSNAKDIGILYFIFAMFSGLIGTSFSLLIRIELSGPGVQYISDTQLYNSLITAHALLMIFFMVD